jgi:zinc transport system substrate-binding protein
VRNRTALIIGVLIAAFLIVGFIYAYPSEERPVSEGGVRVVVSILPLAEFVESVGGEKIDVTVMVGPGESPHTYAPDPQQMVDLSEAEMFVEVGSGVEFELVWMEKIREVNREMLVVDCSKGIDLMGKDPHIWLSPGNAEVMVENICNGLIEVDPENDAYYTENKDEYLAKLDELDKDIKEGLSGVENRVFIVFHPAWGYFARDYDLEQIAIEFEGKTPHGQDIVNLIEEARAKNIKVVFASPQFDKRQAEVIAEEIDGKVVFIDPLAREYITNMYKVLDKLASGLE